MGSFYEMTSLKCHSVGHAASLSFGRDFKIDSNASTRAATSPASIARNAMPAREPTPFARSTEPSETSCRTAATYSSSPPRRTSTSAAVCHRNSTGNRV